MSSIEDRDCTCSSTTKTRAGLLAVAILGGRPVSRRLLFSDTTGERLKVVIPVTGGGIVSTDSYAKGREQRWGFSRRVYSLIVSLSSTATRGVNSSPGRHPLGANCYTPSNSGPQFSRNQNDQRYRATVISIFGLNGHKGYLCSTLSASFQGKLISLSHRLRSSLASSSSGMSTKATAIEPFPWPFT